MLTGRKFVFRKKEDEWDGVCWKAVAKQYRINPKDKTDEQIKAEVLAKIAKRKEQVAMAKALYPDEDKVSLKKRWEFLDTLVSDSDSD